MTRSAPSHTVLAGYLLLHVVVWALLHGAFPWIWLPLAFGLVFPAAAAATPTLRGERFLLPYYLIQSVLFVGLWLRSNFPGEQLAWTSLALALGVVGLLTLRGAFSDSRRLLAWMAPPFFMCLGVAYLSGTKGGSNQMDPIFRHYLGLDPKLVELAVHVVRKVFHFTFYGTFGFLWLRIFGIARERANVAAIHALAMTFCLAGFDELRQSTASNRTGQFSDVILDLSGAATFILIALLLSRKRRPREHALRV